MVSLKNSDAFFSIEYTEANGVMLFHLDYEQNRQEICNSEWPHFNMSADEQIALCGHPFCAEQERF